MADFKINTFPKTRIATNDVCAIGLQKHHISALIEIDVSQAREKIKEYKKKSHNISFTAWLIKVICLTIKDYENVAAYLQGKRKVIVFKDINVSIAVEKDLNGQKVPIPLIIEKANERSLESITRQINDARDQKLTDKDIVLQSKSSRMERFIILCPDLLGVCFGDI